MNWPPFRHDRSKHTPSAGWRTEPDRAVGHDCFADEIAIDFPSVAPVVDRMRDAFLGAPEDRVLAADVRLTPRDAWRGLTVPLDVPITRTCPGCGGRGETWTEPCAECAGTGESLVSHSVRLALPARVADGARFRFRVTSPHAAAVRVEVRVEIRSAA